MATNIFPSIGRIKTVFLIVLSLLSFSFSEELGLPQIKAILDYLEVKSIDEMMNRMADEIMKQFPPEEAALFSAVWNNTNYKSELKSVISNSISQNFTLDEINALISYNGTEEGRSVISKSLSDLMPELLSLDQKSIQSAIVKFKKEKK